MASRHPPNRIRRMTRTTTPRLLAIALAAALAMPHPAAAQAMQPFVVSDIRIEGLQRIAAGTVFTYLPVERGSTLDSQAACDAIRALFATGFFHDGKHIGTQSCRERVCECV